MKIEHSSGTRRRRAARDPLDTTSSYKRRRSFRCGGFCVCAMR